MWVQDNLQEVEIDVQDIYMQQVQTRKKVISYFNFRAKLNLDYRNLVQILFGK